MCDCIRNASIEDLKKVQLEMLANIDAFCMNNLLRYYVAYGTLLGAIRHSGFIPWDDDIDIWMPRKDYEIFVSTYKDSNNNYFVMSPELDESHLFPYAKLYYRDSVVEQLVYKKKYLIPLGIDIFPLDYVPDSRLQRDRSFKKVLFIKKIVDFKLISYESCRSILKRYILSLGNVLLKPISAHKLSLILSKYVRSISLLKSEYVGCYLCPYGMKTITKASDFISTKRIKFENIEVEVPYGYDNILTSLYGDYMTPPKEEKRITTHKSNVYIKEI